MALARLILYPRQADRQPAHVDDLVTALHDIGFIHSEPVDRHYLPADQFLNLLSFLGCSPDIRLHPDDGENYCYIEFAEYTDKPVCLGHTTTVIPGCPRCKNKIRHWKDTEGWQQADTVCRCDRCQTKTAMSKLKWRQECAFGRFSIHIAHVHSHEAVPAEKLLNALESASGFAWDYAYAND